MTDICGICLDTLSESKELPCHHPFHESCVDPWIAKKGTCPTCRFCVAEIENEEDMDLTQITEAIVEFWRRRNIVFEPPPSISEEPRNEPVAEPQIRAIQETPTEWIYEVEGCQGRSLKAHATLVQSQTDAALPTCLYALHKYDNDIVNAILDITGCL